MLLSWLTGSINEAPHNDAEKPAVRSSAQWREHFRANAANQRAIPWEQGLAVTPSEVAEIAGSLPGWQLGETSDGAHLLRAAQRYADRIGDADFLQAVACFIAEEQGHGRMLGRVLDLAGVPRVQSDWGDTLFRTFRYLLPSMEIWATPVVMVETHALIYFQALRDVSSCPVLRGVCEQILSDEIAHVRFQCERLAILHRDRPTWLYAVTMLLQRVLFTGVTLAVWVGHRRALRAGGFGFGRFWRSAWSKMGNAWRTMNPRGYQWESVGQTACVPEPARG
jgi:hypothetical protein